MDKNPFCTTVARLKTHLVWPNTESCVISVSCVDDRTRQMCNSKDCRTALKRVKINNFPCEDWLLMGLRYQHTDPRAPDTDYITIRLDLKDTRSGSIYKVINERMYGSQQFDDLF